MIDSVPTITLAMWRDALAAVLGDLREADAPRLPGVPLNQQPTHKVPVHVTGPDSKRQGAVPVLLDAVPERAGTADGSHTVPARDGLASLPHVAAHAVSAARIQRATAIVPLEPRLAHGVWILSETLVLSPVP